MLGSIGFPELLLIFIVILIVFGPNKLPEFAKTLGKFIREFRKTVDEAKHTIEREMEQADVREDLKKVEKNIKDELEEVVYPLPKGLGDLVSDVPPPAPEVPAADKPADALPKKTGDHEEKSG